MLTCSILFLAALLVSAVPSPPTKRVDGPKVSLPFVGRLNTSGHTIAEIDRARAAHHLTIGKAGSGKRQSSFAVTNQAVDYIASVGVGSPPTTYSLIIDTGSSNTWVGAGKSYVRTSTSLSTGALTEVTYGSGLFFGSEFTDTVALSDSLVITGQSIGSALFSQGFNGVDGILGIGPTDLTSGTVLGLGGTPTVPTVVDNLASQGSIPEKVVGVFFAPTTSESITNGELTFGGIEKSKTTGDVSFVPITSTSPASEFFGIDQSVTYGSAGTTVLPSTAGIVDTGTTLLLIASDAFNTYTSLTGATPDQATGLLSISSENYANLQSLFFNIGDTTFEFTKNAQTWPRALNAAIGGAEGDILLIVADLGTNSGAGLDFINGMTFLERFYSVFDSTNNQVGFATTAHTTDETN